ncbi:MAG: cupin domain-containing protein [Dehalococcoidia bacterium]
MKVVREDKSAETRATAPIFNGTVHSRPLIPADLSPAVSVTMVRFTAGGRTRRHTHTADQILYIADGHGIVATDSEENHVTAGDIVHVPAGEIHWHGAEPGRDMAHLSILPPSQTKVLDD